MNLWKPRQAKDGTHVASRKRLSNKLGWVQSSTRPNSSMMQLTVKNVYIRGKEMQGMGNINGVKVRLACPMSAGDNVWKIKGKV